MKNIKKVLILLLITVIMFLVIVFSAELKIGVINGLIMCANIIIPSLFPFAVLSVFLTNSGLIFLLSKPINKITRFLFKLNGHEFCIFILSLIGGYPIGATLLNQAVKSKIIPHDRAKFMLKFCVNAGPAFIILSVGDGIYHSKNVGVLLLCSHIIASLIIALLSVKKDNSNFCNNELTINNMSDAFVDSTQISSVSILKICSYVVLFAAATNIVKALFFNSFALKIITPFFEVTNGVFLVYKNIYAVCFLLGFGGFCIHMQVYSSIEHAKPKYIHFFLWRIVHGILSCLILKLLLTAFPQYIQTLSNSVSFNFKASSVSIWCSLTLILMSVCLLFSAKMGGKNLKSVLE